KLGDGKWLQLLIALHQDAAVGAHGEGGADRLLTALLAARDYDDLACDAGFLHANGLFYRDLAEGIHRHLDVLRLDAGAVSLHPNLHIGVDHALDGDQYFHGLPITFSMIFSLPASGLLEGAQGTISSARWSVNYRRRRSRPRSLLVLGWHPEYIGTTLVVHYPSQDKQQIRQAVSIADGFGIDAFLGGEFGHPALGPTHDGPPQMQPGRSGAATGKNEGLERLKLRIVAIDGCFQCGDLGGLDPQGRIFRSFLFRRGEIGSQVEEIILHPGQQSIDFPRRMQPSQTNDRVGLVHLAIGSDPRVML